MKISNHNSIIKNLFMMLVCFQLFACSTLAGGDDVEEGKGDNTLVKPKYNKNSVLRNPLNGWVMYAGRTADESYWDTEYYVSDLGKKVKAIDYASACYIRTSWASLNPSDGVYAWDDPNSKIGKLIKGAEERGLPIAFRIVVDGRDQGMNTPQFVFDKGAKYYLENSKFPTRITPIPQDPIFQQYYTKFIEALGEEFNDADRTAFIDAYGLGKWGEAHNVIYEDPETATDERTEQVKDEVFEWVTDLYVRCFSEVPLVINYHRLIGHPESWGAPNENSDRLLVNAINKGYSLRQDAFGMTDYYAGWEKQFAKSWNNKCPIIMEGGWITTGTHRYWTDPSGKYREGHPEDVRQGEFDVSAEAHVNMMDFRVGETQSWFENSFSLVQRFVSEGGYRLYPDQLYLPEKINSGAETVITHRWRNMGWGYCPNNLPQWNYKYKVAFALLDANDNVKKVLVDGDSDPSEWHKDDPISYDFKVSVDLPAGNYTWAVAIVDTSKSNQPGLELAVNEDLSSEGWVKLINLEVE
ncbi:DUF4832 domain-containing protein [Echinicola marina]|uniref:DUF4832 domain-containing protein n=1 Tax=Echinicola marina TaxID=2859768 RepID=UPI001CF6AD73|nr:DUF4832 domain-containing protein [Echinicola marina]UCS95002.1 DUF4832 domain-containing protein [Echinicola marina]